MGVVRIRVDSVWSGVNYCESENYASPSTKDRS